MRNFVQFHNPDVWGEAVDLKDAFRVSTSKSIRRLPDQRMWLISRTGNPRQYFVASTFVVDSLNTDRRRLFPNTVAGSRGQVLGPNARIDTASWWPRLLAQTGSFLWGLTEIRDSSVVRGLERVARGEGVSREPQRSRKVMLAVKHRGAFGDAAKNKLVEVAAVSYAKRVLKRDGWIVESVESEARGFDLLCRRDGRSLHVEVKGVSGDVPAFMITAKELRECRANSCWRLAVVTKARTFSPQLRLWTPSQFTRRFELVPKDHFAILK